MGGRSALPIILIFPGGQIIKKMISDEMYAYRKVA